MLICLSGRLGSGKTLLSSQLMNKGFIRVSFANYLKDLVAETYGCDVNLLKDEVAKKEILEVPWQWNECVAGRFFQLAQINYKFDIEPQKFITRREALQYLGTDVLKKHNSNFHSEKLMQAVKEGDYVCDDLRFVDELVYISGNNTKCYHIIRPSNTNISNHASETSLNWSMFDNNIINDKPVEILQSEFLSNLDIDVKANYKISKYLPFLHANKTSAYYAGVLNQISNMVIRSRKQYKAYLSLDNININKAKFIATEINSAFGVEVISAAETITCPFIIENLKLWKPELDGYPAIIKNDMLLKNHWNEGILMGKSLLL